MNNPDPPGPSRREFIGTVAAAAAAVAAPPALGTPRAQPQATPPAAPPAQPEYAVPPATIAEAEKLAGVQYTDPEREVIARGIGDQIERLRRRAAHPPPPNDLPMAVTFDPRLPGMTFDRPERLVRSPDQSPLPASDEDIAFAPLSRLARWVERRQLTSTRLTRIYLDRLKRYDPTLKCVATLTEDLALAQAAKADEEIVAGRYRGPLHGIPWGAKDLFDTAGIPTTWGAEPYRGRVPQADAAVVTRLREAGAVLVAKLTLGALAYGDIWFGGRTNNPWNPQRGSSGSSAGSAAATAAGLVAFGLGTETLGSIVSPSLTCGVTGLRPTFGRVPRIGAMALCWSLDKVGAICRSAEDCALVLAAIHGRDDGDPSSLSMPFDFDAARPLKGLRLGYSPAWLEGRRAREIDRNAIQIARDLGLELVEFDLPDWPYDSLMNILNCEAAAAFEELTRSNRDDELSWQAPQAWPNTFRETWFIPGVELIQAYRLRRQVMDMMREKFDAFDAIIGGAPRGSLLLITNNTGHPSLTIRAGFREDGTPQGITLVGRLFDEGMLCRLGMAMEDAFGVRDRRPPLS